MGAEHKKLFNGDEGFAQTSEKLNDTVAHRKESVVAPCADAYSGAGVGTYLTDNDLAGLDYFTTVFFDPPALAGSGTPLTCGSTCFDV